MAGTICEEASHDRREHDQGSHAGDKRSTASGIHEIKEALYDVVHDECRDERQRDNGMTDLQEQIDVVNSRVSSVD